MKAPLPFSIITLALTVTAVFFTTNARSENVVAETAPVSSGNVPTTKNVVTETAPVSPGNVPTTIYRQVLPDGRVVYSDKAVKNGKVETITVPPQIKGNLWTTEPSQHPDLPHQAVPTQIIKAPSLSQVEKRKIAEQAAASVIRAEMLLEDAKRKQEDGVEPLAGERTGNVDGNTRLNAKYEARQKSLAKDVAKADAALKKAREDQDALR